MQVAQSTLDLSSALIRVRSFLSWWKSELAGLWPWRPVLGRYAPCIVARLCPDHVDIIDERTVLPVMMTRLKREEGLEENVRRLLANVATGRGGRPHVGLRLERSLCFERTAVYPLATRDNLQEIFEHELAHATLFSRANSYCGYRIDRTDYADRKLFVRQVFARRDVVDAAIQDGQALGWAVDFIDVGGSEPADRLQIDLLPPKDQPPSRQMRAMKSASATLVALALSALVVVQRHQSLTLEALPQRVAQSRAQAMAARAQFDRVSATGQRLSSIVHRKAGRLALTEIVEEVSRILPDWAFLQELRMEGATLHLTGIATSAADLVPIFDKSPLFARPRLSAPVTLDPREKRETFQIEMDIRQERQRGSVR